MAALAAAAAVIIAACDDVRHCAVSDDVTHDGVDEGVDDVVVGFRNSLTDHILGLDGVVEEVVIGVEGGLGSLAGSLLVLPGPEPAGLTRRSSLPQLLSLSFLSLPSSSSSSSSL